MAYYYLWSFDYRPSNFKVAHLYTVRGLGLFIIFQGGKGSVRRWQTVPSIPLSPCHDESYF